MNNIITEQDINIAFSKWIDLRIRLLVLNSDDSILYNIEGITVSGSLEINASSYSRRSYNLSVYPFEAGFNLQDKVIEWMNCSCQLQIGIKTLNMNDYKWYNQGRFTITSTSFSYDAENNTLSISCGDLYTQFDGTINGMQGSQIVRIPAYEEDSEGNPVKYNTIKESIATVLKTFGQISKFFITDIGSYKGMREHNINYQEYRELNPQWNCIPYDLEFSCGCTTGEILSQLINLYPNYDGAFNEDGTFIVSEIPSCESDPVIFDDYNIRRAFISENTSRDLTKVRNICEVWGKTIDTDYYSEDCTFNAGVYDVNIDGYDEYYTGDIISMKIPHNNIKAQSINVNGLGAAYIYDESTEKPLEAELCLAGEIYSFKCKKSYENGNFIYKFYFLGQWQPHAVNVLTDGTVIRNGYVMPDGHMIDKYSKEYFSYVYNCDNVKFTTVASSPFTVQRIGERLDVKSGSEYDSITSSSLAAERAAYENRKNSRITDSITIVLNRILPWISENMKVSYTPVGCDSPKEYITSTINLDFSGQTTTITMYSFYSLYEENTLRGTNQVISEYSHGALSDFSHLELINAQ